MAVSVSFALALIFSRLGPGDVRRVGVIMRPWNFVAIILGMFIFLNIFQASGASQLIAELAPSKVMLCVVVGFLLSMATGRVQLPASVVIPIYLTTYGQESMTPLIFTFIFVSMLLGYDASPVHPCVSVSLEYFKVPMKDFLRIFAPPTFLTLAVVLVTASILI